MRFVLLIVGLLVVGNLANSAEFPICYDKNHRKVTFTFRSQEFFLRHGVSTGMAIEIRGHPFVFLDRNIKKLSSIFQQHVILHECAHHQLGHTTSRTMGYNLASEFQADCSAIKRMVDLQILTSEEQYQKLRSQILQHIGGIQNERIRRLDECVQRALDTKS